MLELNSLQQAMLDGKQGRAKQMGMRLLLDMAAAGGATELIPIKTAHLSGVSPLTGGLGLRQFLAKLARDTSAQVAVPTTLNSAGCDAGQFEAMRIVAPNFLEHSQEIVALYTQLGVQPIQSCIPYEWEGITTEGEAAWAESNAICFGNSYTGLVTNRESGLSALASALTGFTPRYGLLLPEARHPNLEVIVSCEMGDPTDFSILGDWIGKQRKGSWQMRLGLIPLIRGLPASLSHDQRKALSSSAANYGCPLLYIEGQGDIPTPDFQEQLHFSADDLAQRYADLAPKQPVSLVVIGCPQASVGELRATAMLLRSVQLTDTPLWVFTSRQNLEIAERTGIAGIIRKSGALLLADTCPEVVPYDQSWVKQILTNSLKAEHYIKSGLNGIPTSVMKLADCVSYATQILDKTINDRVQTVDADLLSSKHQSPVQAVKSEIQNLRPKALTATYSGSGLPSQTDFEVSGEAFVTDAPITLLGFVNRQTGVIEEEGHPANGQSMAGKIAIFPKGSGSTVAPYVLLELLYRGNAPIAIVNTEIDQQSAPACSLEGIPYAYRFSTDILHHFKTGDRIILRRVENVVTLTHQK